MEAGSFRGPAGFFTMFEYYNTTGGKKQAAEEKRGFRTAGFSYRFSLDKRPAVW